MIIEFSYEQATSIVGENSGKIARIKDKLLKVGYMSVDVEGRGKKAIFKCVVDTKSLENTSKVYYDQFRQRLIGDYRFGKKFDYDTVLKFLEFHAKNREEKRAMNLKEIAKEIGISERTIKKYRENLKDVLTDRLTSEKVLFGLHEDEDIYRKIDDELLNNIIYKVYASEMKKIEEMFPSPNIKDEVAIFIDKKVGTYRLIPRAGDFDYLRDRLKESGLDYQSSYAVSFGDKVVKDEFKKRVISGHLKRKIFELICKENHIEHTVDKYIYTLRNEILQDDEFMNEMANAIDYMKNKKD